MNKPTISLIAALSENRVIGRDNALPWHIPDDLKRFRKITSGHPVIMGRKTYESIGRPLPNRLNIVLSRNPFDFTPEGVVRITELHEAIRLASDKELIKASLGTEYENINCDEIFIIGGGQIFEQAIGLATKLYLTLVHTTIEGDAFFPDYSMFTEVLFQEDGQTDEYTYTFLDLAREDIRYIDSK